jgi:hypothetical protein
VHHSCTFKYNFNTTYLDVVKSQNNTVNCTYNLFSIQLSTSIMKPSMFEMFIINVKAKKTSSIWWQVEN